MAYEGITMCMFCLSLGLMIVCWVSRRIFIRIVPPVMLSDFSEEIKNLLKEKDPLIQQRKLKVLSSEELEDVKSQIVRATIWTQIIIFSGMVLAITIAGILEFLPVPYGTIYGDIGLILAVIALCFGPMFGLCIVFTIPALALGKNANKQRAIEKTIHKKIAIKNGQWEIVGDFVEKPARLQKPNKAKVKKETLLAKIRVSFPY